VWASPPCEGYSPQRRSEFAKKGTEFAKSVLELADTYVRVTLDFIRAAAALCWVLENPRQNNKNAPWEVTSAILSRIEARKTVAR
jgi:hypothetical protein